MHLQRWAVFPLAFRSPAKSEWDYVQHVHSDQQISRWIQTSWACWTISVGLVWSWFFCSVMGKSWAKIGFNFTISSWSWLVWIWSSLNFCVSKGRKTSWRKVTPAISGQLLTTSKIFGCLKFFCSFFRRTLCSCNLISEKPSPHLWQKQWNQRNLY